MKQRTLHAGMPSDGSAYLVKIGLIVWLIAELEGTLIYDLIAHRHCMPVELDVEVVESRRVTGLTVQKLGEYFIEHGPKITDVAVAEYYLVGGEILKEIGPKRNAMLHSRPGGQSSDGKIVLLRMRASGQQEAFAVSATWLDEFIARLDELRIELEAVRPLWPAGSNVISDANESGQAD